VTVRANAADLDHDVPRAKTARPCGQANDAKRIRRIGLDDAIATLADERDRLWITRMLGHTSEKSVAAFEPVNETRALKHLQDSIDGDRREPLSFLSEALDQIVCADRLVASRDMPKNLLSQRRPLYPKLQASRSGAPERILHANAVVVVARGKGGGFLSEHAIHVMLLRIFGNSLRSDLLKQRRISAHKVR
jgi:hypothetical protein